MNPLVKYRLWNQFIRVHQPLPSIAYISLITLFIGTQLHKISLPIWDMELYLKNIYNCLYVLLIFFYFIRMELWIAKIWVVLPWIVSTPSNHRVTAVVHVLWPVLCWGERIMKVKRLMTQRTNVLSVCAL